MTLSDGMVFEVRTAGSDSNGGGFLPGSGGTDYSQQNVAELSVSDGSASGTTTLTSSTGGFTSAMVGNVLQITGGTLTTGFYEITAFTDANNVVLDRTPGTGSGSTVNVGGALASPALASQACLDSTVLGGTIHIKSGTYTISNNTPNTANGPMNTSSSSLGSRDSLFRIIGYETTREDGGTKPVLQATTGSMSLIVLGRYAVGRNIEVDGNSQSSVVGIELGFGSNYAIECVARNCTTQGFDAQLSASDRHTIRCLAQSCGTGFFGSAAHRCIADSCSGSGFDGNTTAVSCIADSCNVGFEDANTLAGCIAYGCTSHGFRAYFSVVASHCIAYNNGGYGFEQIRGATLVDAAAGANSSGNYQYFGDYVEINSVALTADPFVDAASGDFNLNDTAGGGAVLRAVSDALNASTDYYPFRNFVSDSFGGGGGGSGGAAILGGTVLRG